MTIPILAATLLLATSASTTPAGPRPFATPEEAGRALVAAAETFDLEELKAILGPDGLDLVVTEDTVQDKKQAAAFAAVAKERFEVVRDPKSARKATLVVGTEGWPSPIPIVEKKGGWSFDIKEGRQEILYRRIGRNELDAIQVCRGFVEAQHEYVFENPANYDVPQYAQRIISTPGLKDGLAWQNGDGTWAGPVGEGIARVIAEGYVSRYEPYHGYYFKVLRSQGPSARLGEMSYVIKGIMIGGFALAAAPSDYGVTGIKSFIVSQDGVVYERDLGDETDAWFKSVQVFDPDKKWTPVEDDE